MRKFIRHPSDIPIQYKLVDVVSHSREYLRNISEGGLSFQAKVPLQKGAVIRIGIPLIDPSLEVSASVSWCKKTGKFYDVGVRFMNPDVEFKMRMVEQVCHIEHYRKEVLESEGREISGEEAAIEWIKIYAKDFPS